MKTVALKPNASMIEVMRRFRSVGSNTKIIKAKYTKAIPTPKEMVDEDGFILENKNKGRPAFWSLLFIGDTPDLYGLVQ